MGVVLNLLIGCKENSNSCICTRIYIKFSILIILLYLIYNGDTACVLEKFLVRKFTSREKRNFA